ALMKAWFERIPAYIKAVFVMQFLALIFLTLWLAASVLIPMCIALILAMLLLPMVKRLEKWRVPSVLAVSLALLALVITFGSIAAFFSVQLAGFTDEAPLLRRRFQYILDNANEKINDWAVNKLNLDPKYVEDLLQFELSGASHSAGTLIGVAFEKTTGMMLTVGLSLIFAFFFLLYRKSFHKFFVLVTPEHRNRTFRRVVRNIEKLAQNYVVGLFTVVLVIGTIVTLGLTVLGIKYAVLLGFLSGMLVVVPYIGLATGYVLTLLVTVVTKDSGWYFAGVTLVFVLTHLLESNLITPNIVGNKVKINPMAAMAALFVGQMIWGVAGMVLAIPMLAMVKVVFDHVDELQPYGFLLGSEFADNVYEPYDEELDEADVPAVISLKTSAPPPS
ncbi:MAG: AI-2E family transporter, partial [Bacteroidia bacterium]|nr:AI-2E family transporter [Bacteroidia bacterium]